MPIKALQKKAIEDTRKYFEGYNFQELSQKKFTSKDLVAAWRGSISCNGEAIGIIVGLPYSYPDELPKIYLTNDFEYYPIPHVDSNNFVCTFDSDRIEFFSENIAGILAETIEKARSIIADGISGKNSNDFEREFLAYWSDGAASQTIYSIIDPKDVISEIQLAIVSPTDSRIKYIAGNKKDEIKRYIKNLDPLAKITSLQPCLYLPFHTIPHPPFPQNNKELFSYLRNINQKYEKAVYDFISKCGYQGVVFFSVNIGESYIFASWKHNSPKLKDILKGFRPGKVTSIVVKNRISLQKVIRFGVDRIDGDRLQRRIGNDNNVMKNKSVCLIGCGSLGSEILFLLAKSGIEKFTLIDNDILKPENISRHRCGMSDVNQPKVNALMKKISAHFPHVVIEKFNKRFHQAFNENPEYFYNADIIISAIGNTAIERRLNQVHLESEKFPTVLYSWIEPYGIASHAVLIVKGRGGCFQCCLEKNDLKFRFSVAEFEEKDLKIQEAGCQTAYTPYSALEAIQASMIASRLVIAYFNGEVTQSTRFLWLSDLQILDRMGYQKKTIYDELPHFTLNSYKVEKQLGCLHCE